MPLLKHAKKKLRQDKKPTEKNRKIKEVFKKLLKKAKEVKTPEAVNSAVSSIDKAAKKNILHKNKAARLKAALSKTVTGKETVSAPKKALKKKVTTKKKTVTKKKK